MARHHAATRTDRGLASGIIIFAAMLVVGGLLFIALNAPASDIFTVADGYTTNSAAQDHVDLMETMWGGVLVFITGLAAVFIIARAVFESRRP